ncbi:MAG: hypothetical protein BVN35_06120, partial [Proteobacteria bacterium ST_bin11]
MKKKTTGKRTKRQEFTAHVVEDEPVDLVDLAMNLGREMNKLIDTLKNNLNMIEKMVETRNSSNEDQFTNLANQIHAENQRTFVKIQYLEASIEIHKRSQVEFMMDLNRADFNVSADSLSSSSSSSSAQPSSFLPSTKKKSSRKRSSRPGLVMHSL